MRVKQFLNLLLCLFMILTLLPMLSIPASAKPLSGIGLGTKGIIGYSSITDSYNYLYYGEYSNSPIKWRVLAETNGNGGTYKDSSNANVDGTNAMFLLSEYLLDADIKFDNSSPLSNVWQDSDAQNWCTTFYNGSNFSSTEGKAILRTSKTDSEIFDKQCAASSIVEEQVFFLSFAEVYDSPYFKREIASWKTYTFSNEAISSLWWLRTPSSFNTQSARSVDVDGAIVSRVVQSNMTARPAFNLNKDAVLFSSAATETDPGGKVSGSEGADALAKVSTTKPNEWKLTLLDNNRNFGVLPTAVSANSVSFDYYGAKTGANEYISAIVVDDLGYILYYGRIMNVSIGNSSGLATINIPSGITLGNNATLKVFNEQYNGDYKTDYASALQSVAGHKVTYSLVNVEKINGSPVYAMDGEDCTISLKANKGYCLPPSVSVTVGGNPAMRVSSADETDEAGEYCYVPDESSQTAEIFIAKVNGPVVITAEGVSAISTLPKSLDFGSSTEGYATAPDMQTFDIANNGNDTVTLKSITGGADYTYGYTKNMSITPGAKISIGIWPAYDLTVGPHNDTLTIQTNEGSTATVNLSFTVSAKPSSGGGGYSPSYYTIAASAGTGGSIRPSGSGSVEYGSNFTYAIAADKGFKIQDILADGVSVGAVSTYTFKNVSTSHTIIASFKKTETLNPFTDINKNDRFYDSVMYAYENDLMTGTASDMFSPSGTTTRGMIVTVLHRLSGDKGSYTNSCSDVPSGAWYETAAAWAAANGIAGGVGGNQFAPENSLTREQLAVMLYNYAKYKGLNVSVGENTNILSYNDGENVSDYARAALQWACGAGIIKGDNGNLNPQAYATRAEVAAMLERFIK